MILRLATDDDCEWFWKLAMEPSVREMSVRSESFTYAEHEQWWARRAHEADTRIYVGLDEPTEVRYDSGEVVETLHRTRVGHLRFGRVSGTTDAEIAISVEPYYRGRGHATDLLRQGEPLAREALGVDRFVALVLVENTASRKLFENSGYQFIGWETRMKKQCRKYVKR